MITPMPVTAKTAFRSTDSFLLSLIHIFHCHRCVNTCAKVSGRNAIKVGKTGMFNVINAPFGPDWESTACESCGNCAEACPTGALYKNCLLYTSRCV